MLKLFEIKSSCNRDKTAYHVITKQYLVSSNLTWMQLPSDLVPESLISEIRNLVAPSKVLEQLVEVQDVSVFEQMTHRFDSKFKTMLELFLDFYEKQVQTQLEFFSE